MTLNPPPRVPGSYALFLALDQPTQLNVGRMGRYSFLPGWYVYCGSAFGPGGLAARMERHRAGYGALHWHIDHLRRAARLVDWAWAAGARLECAWSRAYAAAGGQILVPKFGASDCRAGCPAHLVYFAAQDPRQVAAYSRIFEAVSIEAVPSVSP